MPREDFKTAEEYTKHLIKELAGIVDELGWSIAIPQLDDEDEFISGMVIGEDKYIEAILGPIPEDAPADGELLN